MHDIQTQAVAGLDADKETAVISEDSEIATEPGRHRLEEPADTHLQSTTDEPSPKQGIRKAQTMPQPRSGGRGMTDRPRPSQKTSSLPLHKHVTNATLGALESDVSSEERFSTDEGANTARKSLAGINADHQVQTGSSLSPSPRYHRFIVSNDSFRTQGRVSSSDGRLNIRVKEGGDRGYLARTLDATLNYGHKNDIHSKIHHRAAKRDRRPGLSERLATIDNTSAKIDKTTVPVLNIVVMVIGSRGDIQPFLKLGKVLKLEHGHRVRIATHPAFKEFIEKDSGLEFFSVGGDPAELMAFMVKNPGLMPSLSTLKAGEVGRRRNAMSEMFQGFWRACINASDDETDPSNLKLLEENHPFIADAIIANPPSFAHIHCAERLGIPLHLMFTFPYSPTQSFPHPLANIKKTNIDANHTNFMSYPLVEMMTWQGLGDLINKFRVKTLGLEEVSTLWAPGQLFRLKVPYTYLWSPGLIPKPPDWGPEIDIAGFVFLDLASSFKPPESLAKFLDDGEAPIYIGFGSIVVDDPDAFTSMIFEAVRQVGVRALVSKGWGGLGDENRTPENVYMLENTPHDWLFPRCRAVVHHGGAGTTAIGLKCGKPTMIVPFFGDQPFWGAMVAKAGAGAQQAVPYKDMSAEKLAEGIRQCLSTDAGTAAERIAEDIAVEGDGASNAVESFHHCLESAETPNIRCSILPEKVAAWTLRKSDLRLSSLVASILVRQGKLRWSELKLITHRDWSDFEGPGEPITGGGAAVLGSAATVAKELGGVPVKWTQRIGSTGYKGVKRKRTRANIGKADKHRELTPKGESFQPEKSPDADKSDRNDDGIGTHLPDSHTIQGRASEPIQDDTFAHGNQLHPMASAPRASATESLDKDESGCEHVAVDLIHDTGGRLARAGEALAKAPMDLSMAVAQGFHNAPRLYGDSTVRTVPRITGIKSGLRAAGSEFVHGIQDGTAGLVTQPYHGARERGAVGFISGVGKGLGGFILKDLAAITSPVGFTMKGIHKEMTKKKQPTAFIRRARVQQGTIELLELRPEQEKAIQKRVEDMWVLVAKLRTERQK